MPLRPTRCAFLDSFKAARRDFESLFAKVRSEEDMRRAVRPYLAPSSSHSWRRPHSERLARSQELSRLRTNTSLLLQEARRRGNHRVAAAALDVVLSEVEMRRFALNFEPAWIKDAISSCRNAEELHAIKGVLQRHEKQLLASGSVAASEGFLLASALGHSRAIEKAPRLGDDAPTGDGELMGDAEADSQTEAAHANSTLSDPSPLPAAEVGLPARGSSISLPGHTEVAPVWTALAQPPSPSDIATSGDTKGVHNGLWSSPAQRAAAGVHQLQRHQRDVTAGPNVSFTRYFLRQGLVRDESELRELYQAMRSRPLDVSFRVIGGGQALATSSTAAYAPLSTAVHKLLRGRSGLHRVTWLPPRMGAYTMDTRPSIPQETVRANRELLRSLARDRLIVFQSLPSMLSVCYLDPQPGERVLDLCASPGNKTELILDCMHGSMTAAAPYSSANASAAAEATAALRCERGGQAGCVVANEVQASRLRVLTERLRDLSPDVVITRGHGQSFGMPDAGLHHSSGDAASWMGAGLYDRVLVDAPCSGEGRMGRDALSWRLWHPSRAIELFPVQYRLLLRAMQLCKTGGRVVYATCTLNPLENEAVVAAVLRACGGAVHLVSPSSPRLPPRGSKEPLREDGVPPLRLTAGLGHWEVPSRAGGFLRTAAEAYAQGESVYRLPPELFAPTTTTTATAACAAEGDEVILSDVLPRCCRRIFPHLNGNTDGFFVAILTKSADLPPAQAAASDAHSGGSSRIRTLLAAPAASSQAASPSLAFHSPRMALRSHAVSLTNNHNMLHDRGLVRLPPSHHLVQKHLGCFFTHSPAGAKHVSAFPTAASTGTAAAAVLQQQRKDRCASAAEFLERCGWNAMWHEGEGLRLLSQSATQLLRSHATAPLPSDNPTEKGVLGGRGFEAPPRGFDVEVHSSPSLRFTTELLDAGVLVINSKGALTERGAALLRHTASSRVVSLPLLYAQLLLANRVLDVGTAFDFMPAFMRDAERALSSRKGLLRSEATSRGIEAASSTGDTPGVPPWCRAVLSALTSVATSSGAAATIAGGNAIVTVDVSPSSSTISDASHAWAVPLASWSWPVRVEVVHSRSSTSETLPHELVRLHLELTPAARHRALALIGRLQGHAHRRRSPVDQQQAHLANTARHAPNLNRDVGGPSRTSLLQGTYPAGLVFSNKNAPIVQPSSEEMLSSSAERSGTIIRRGSCGGSTAEPSASDTPVFEL